MHQVFHVLGMVSFAGLVVTSLAGMFLMAQLFRVLERDSPRTYEALGRPSLVLQNSISGTFRVLRYLFDREYLEDPSEKVRVVAACCWLAFRLGLVCQASCMVLLVMFPG